MFRLLKLFELSQQQCRDKVCHAIRDAAKQVSVCTSFMTTRSQDMQEKSDIMQPLPIAVAYGQSSSACNDSLIVHDSSAQHKSNFAGINYQHYELKAGSECIALTQEPNHQIQGYIESEKVPSIHMNVQTQQFHGMVMPAAHFDEQNLSRLNYTQVLSNISADTNNLLHSLQSTEHPIEAGKETDLTFNRNVAKTKKATSSTTVDHKKDDAQNSKGRLDNAMEANLSQAELFELETCRKLVLDINLVLKTSSTGKTSDVLVQSNEIQQPQFFRTKSNANMESPQQNLSTAGNHLIVINDQVFPNKSNDNKKDSDSDSLLQKINSTLDSD